MVVISPSGLMVMIVLPAASWTDTLTSPAGLVTLVAKPSASAANGL